MAEIHKLSVEKTLNKIRGDDAKQSKEAAFKGKIDVLDGEIGRMRAQRLRLNVIKGRIIKKATQSPLPRNVIRSGSWYRAYSGFCADKPMAVQEHAPEIAPVGATSGNFGSRIAVLRALNHGCSPRIALRPGRQVDGALGHQRSQTAGGLTAQGFADFV